MYSYRSQATPNRQKPIDCPYDHALCQPVKSDDSPGSLCAHCRRYISAEQKVILDRERRPSRASQQQPL
jgi:hypothetical protein